MLSKEVPLYEIVNFLFSDKEEYHYSDNFCEIIQRANLFKQKTSRVLPRVITFENLDIEVYSTRFGTGRLSAISLASEFCIQACFKRRYSEHHFWYDSHGFYYFRPYDRELFWKKPPLNYIEGQGDMFL